MDIFIYIRRNLITVRLQVTNRYFRPFQQLGKPAMVEPQPPNRLFEQYQQNLQKQAQQQALDQARSNARNLSNPKCQFWLQQDQNAPNEKTRANVLQFCD